MSDTAICKDEVIEVLQDSLGTDMDAWRDVLESTMAEITECKLCGAEFHSFLRVDSLCPICQK